jgi:hypothetical protein
MKSTDLRKGMRVQLRNGWEATLEDNQTRGQTRLCTVYGIVTEIGSVYTSDITHVLYVDDAPEQVELTETQIRAKRARALAGF